MARHDLTIRTADCADIPRLATLFLESTDGLAAWLLKDAIPGRPTNVIAEHLFTMFGTAMVFTNWRVAVRDAEVLGGVFGSPVDQQTGGPKNLLVPEDRRVLAAPFLGQRTPDAFHIMSICVDAAARGAGIGRALMETADTSAREAGLGLVSLNVRDDNTGAVSLYRRLGYTETKRAHASVPGVFDGDVIHMVRELPDPPRPI
jgi:ribosomal protein S18 acetylase RimI-like enzyme